MFRKISLSAMLALILVVVFSMATFAQACGDFTTILNKANASIQVEIDKAVSDANNAAKDLADKIDYTNLLLKRGSISKMEADGRIRNYKADFNNLLDAIADRLISRTDGIVVNLLQEAQRRGIKVSVTYTTVNLAGRIYLIDPLRIVGN